MWPVLRLVLNRILRPCPQGVLRPREVPVTHHHTQCHFLTHIKAILALEQVQHPTHRITQQNLLSYRKVRPTQSHSEFQRPGSTVLIHNTVNRTIPSITDKLQMVSKRLKQLIKKQRLTRVRDNSSLFTGVLPEVVVHELLMFKRLLDHSAPAAWSEHSRNANLNPVGLLLEH